MIKRKGFEDITFDPPPTPLLRPYHNSLEVDSKNLLSWIQYNGLKANPDKFHLLLSEMDENLSMDHGRQQANIQAPC